MIFLDKDLDNQVDGYLGGPMAKTNERNIWEVGTHAYGWTKGPWPPTTWVGWESFEYRQNEFEGSRVLYVGVNLGNWGGEAETRKVLYVDDVIINGEKHDFEPSN